MTRLALHRKIEELELALLPDRQKATTDEFFARYGHDAVLYATEHLGIKHLSPDQEAVLRAISGPPPIRLLVPSGNETGKSFIGAVASSWHYDCFRPGLTIMTAPSKAQVNDIIFRELRLLRKRDPGFQPKNSRLSDGDDRLCYGFTAKEHSSFQGRHDADVMLIFDEAEGIAPEFWTAAESFAHRHICFYNPTEANSQASVEEMKKGWTVIRMSALNHPNIARGEQGLPPLIPSAVTLTRLKHRLEKWARKLDPGDDRDERDILVDGEWWRPGPVADARILGRRPLKPINAVFDRKDIHRLEDEVRLILNERAPLQIGVDVARFGDDDSVIHARRGMCSIHHEAHNGWNGPRLAARVQEIARQYSPNDPGAFQVPILIDDIGAGSSVMDNPGGFRFIGVNASARADEPEEYINLRAQMHFDFEEMIRHGYVDLSRVGDSARRDIVEEMRAAAYVFGTLGRRKVLEKDKIKANLGRSPDNLDAILLAYYMFPPEFEFAQKRPRP